MSEPDNNPPPLQQRRRSFVEILNPRMSSSAPSNNATAAAPISTSPSSAVPASPNVPQRRGMSIALGLSGSPGSQPSPYNAFARQRRASISASSASGSPEFRNSFDENAVIEEDDAMKAAANSPPSPTFARRLSFGAQALRDVKQTSGTNSGRRTSTSLFTLSEDSEKAPPLPPPSSSSSTRSPGSAKAAGEGFNWSDALRDRNKRVPSISTANPFSHNRAKSFNTPTTTPIEPPQEMPKVAPPVSPPQRLKKPDHLGERMLRGEFMMD